MRMIELTDNADLNTLAMSIATWSRSVVVHVGGFGLVTNSWRLSKTFFQFISVLVLNN